MNAVRIDGCKKTQVTPLPKILGFSSLRVTVAYGGEIPLHRHTCPATMIVVRGSAWTLLPNGQRGRPVVPGNVITKKALEFHGFTRIGRKGFSFISLSGGKGIIRGSGKTDIQFAH